MKNEHSLGKPPYSKAERHYHAEISADPAFTPQNDLTQRQYNILKLQRTHGNAAVCRMLGKVQRAADSAGGAGSSKPLDDDVIAGMTADIDQMVSILRHAYVNEVDEERIVLIVERWADYDQDTSGQKGPVEATPALDKFLLLLKMRDYKHSNLRSGWFEQTSLVFDDLWHRLSDDHLARFKAAQAKSKRQAASGPGSAQNENFWKILGKQEAMGIFGALGGITQGAAGIVDSGAWAITKAMKAAGLPVADPASAAQWIADQYKFSGDQIFGEEYSKGDKLAGGMNAAELGSAGGNLIWTLVSVQTGAAKAMTIFNIASALKGVNDAAENIARIVAEKQTKGTLSASELLTDPNFLVECSKLAVSIFGAVSAGSASNSKMAETAAKSMHRIGLLLNTMLATAQFGQLVDIAMSDKPPAEKSAAAGQVVVALLNTGASMLPADPNMKWTEFGGGKKGQSQTGTAAGNGANIPVVQRPKVTAEYTVHDPNSFEFDKASSNYKPATPETPIPNKPDSVSGLKTADETEPTDKTTTGAGGKGGSKKVNPPNVPPEGTVLARGADPEIIHSVYIDASRQNGNSGVEVGVYRRPLPGGGDEYVVVQGRIGAISKPGSDWTAVSHFHPGAETQPGTHNPAPQDLTAAMTEFRKNPKTAHSEKVHSFRPNGTVMEVTFGLDPKGPGGLAYFVDIPGQQRKYFHDLWPDSANAAVNNANSIHDPDARLQAVLAVFRKLPETCYARWWADQFT